MLVGRKRLCFGPAQASCGSNTRSTTRQPQGRVGNRGPRCRGVDGGAASNAAWGLQGEIRVTTDGRTEARGRSTDDQWCNDAP